MPRAGIRGVSFDVDDTLIDYARAMEHGLAAIGCAAADVRLWDELTRALHALWVAGTLSHTAYQRARLAALFAALGRPVPAVGHLDELEAARRQAAESQLALYLDVRPCLDALRAAGIAVAVLSNSDGPSQRRRLAVLGLDDAFSVVALSGETGLAKPHPAAFRAVCDGLGLDPHNVAHVGDSPSVDAAGASAAGLTGVWLDRHGGAGGPAPRIDTLLDLPALLARI